MVYPVADVSDVRVGEVEGLEEGARLAEGAVIAEVNLDPGKEDVHYFLSILFKFFLIYCYC